jgi:hypothetical protein
VKTTIEIKQQSTKIKNRKHTSQLSDSNKREHNVKMDIRDVGTMEEGRIELALVLFLFSPMMTQERDELFLCFTEVRVNY